MWVYFIQGPPDSPIKIGISRDVRKRLDTLQTNCPWPLRILRKVESADARRTERDLHEKFRHLRVSGEWFAPEPELVEYIFAFQPYQINPVPEREPGAPPKRKPAIDRTIFESAWRHIKTMKSVRTP